MGIWEFWSSGRELGNLGTERFPREGNLGNWEGKGIRESEKGIREGNLGIWEGKGVWESGKGIWEFWKF